METEAQRGNPVELIYCHTTFNWYMKPGPIDSQFEVHSIISQSPTSIRLRTKGPVSTGEDGGHSVF